MKRTLVIALFSIASLFTIGSASAQNLGVQTTVPFAFTVDGHVLPANTYTITSTEYGVVTIQSVDRRSAVFAVALHTDRQLAGGGKLVFAKYGNQYFLHEVLCPVASMNVVLPTSKLEEKTRRQQAKQQANLTDGETTLVAARYPPKSCAGWGIRPLNRRNRGTVFPAAQRSGSRQSGLRRKSIEVSTRGAPHENDLSQDRSTDSLICGYCYRPHPGLLHGQLTGIGAIDRCC